MYLQKLHYNGIIISGKIKKDFNLIASNDKYFLIFHILKYEVAYLDKMRRVTDINFLIILLEKDSVTECAAALGSTYYIFQILSICLKTTLS